MLFTFNRFWKSLLTLIGVWVLYAMLGYEFTVITLLGALLASQFKSSKHII